MSMDYTVHNPPTKSLLQLVVNSFGVSPNVNDTSTPKSSFNKFSLWHSRLGHANAVAV